MQLRHRIGFRAAHPLAARLRISLTRSRSRLHFSMPYPSTADRPPSFSTETGPVDVEVSQERELVLCVLPFGRTVERSGHASPTANYTGLLPVLDCLVVIAEFLEH